MAFTEANHAKESNIFMLFCNGFLERILPYLNRQFSLSADDDCSKKKLENKERNGNEIVFMASPNGEKSIEFPSDVCFQNSFVMLCD